MKKLKVKNVIISKQFEYSNNYFYFLKIANESNIICTKAGDVISIDNDLSIHILWPIQDFIKENVLNNNSLVAKVQYKDVTMMFTGDIEENAEKRIVDLYGKGLKSDILKVAHHGSKSSSIQQFIEAVRPRTVLIGVGEKNIFGHPSVDVVSRLKRFTVLEFIEQMKWERL